MIGLDTNVLVRYITQDDPTQSLKATELIESLDSEHVAYITTVSIIELVWVLSKAYNASKQELCHVIETLLQIKFLVIQDAETVWKALRTYRSGMADFADCLIIHSAIHAECTELITFDVKASKFTVVGSGAFKVKILG